MLQYTHLTLTQITASKRQENNSKSKCTEAGFHGLSLVAFLQCAAISECCFVPFGLSALLDKLIAMLLIQFLSLFHYLGAEIVKYFTTVIILISCLARIGEHVALRCTEK